MKKIMKHIASFALVLAVIVVPQVAFALDITSPADFGWKTRSEAAGTATGFGLSTATPSDILKLVISYALYIIGFLGVLAFIISGIMYLISAGDEKKAGAAKANMTAAIMGIVVALIGFVVIYAVSTLVGASTGGL